MKRTRNLSLALALLLAVAMLSSCFLIPNQKQSIDLSNIPDFSGDPYVEINNNVPEFTKDEITTTAYEKYSELDILGRCGTAEACCGKELMPKESEERESISSVTPSGWVQAEYDFIDGKYLYNRCHLIGWQLTAENANEKNLIAGTKYLNIEGMLYFENKIDDYIEDTGNHVMYRVTPIYYKNDLLPRGVHMEGYSVEDEGKGISFNVYCYNVQPGVTIDYASGRSCRAGETIPPASTESKPEEEHTGPYVLNVSSKKIHKSSCKNAINITPGNKQEFTGDLSELVAKGYSCCGICLKDITLPESTTSETTKNEKYVVNTSSKKIHYPDCHYTKSLSDDKKNEFIGDLATLIGSGYEKCGTCFK